VQARVVIDAIVSNKTFANATVPVTRDDFYFDESSKRKRAATYFEIFTEITRHALGQTGSLARFVSIKRRFLAGELHSLRCAGERGDTYSFLGGVSESGLGRAILEKPFAAPYAAEPT
jgi:hypothetical protein